MEDDKNTKEEINRLLNDYKIDKEVLDFKTELAIRSDPILRLEKTNDIFHTGYHSWIYLLFCELRGLPTLISITYATLVLIIYIPRESEKLIVKSTVIALAIIAFRAIYMVIAEKIIDKYFKGVIYHIPSYIVHNKTIRPIDKRYLNQGDVLDLMPGEVIGAECIILSEDNFKIRRCYTPQNNISECSAIDILEIGDKIISGKGRAVVIKVGQNYIFQDRNPFKSKLENEVKIFVKGILFIGIILSIFLSIPLLIRGIHIEKLLYVVVTVILVLLPKGLIFASKILMITTINNLTNGPLVRDKSAIPNLGISSIIIANSSVFISNLYDCKYIFDGNNIFEMNEDLNIKESLLEEPISIAQVISLESHIIIKFRGLRDISNIYTSNLRNTVVESIKFGDDGTFRTVVIQNGQRLMFVHGFNTKILSCCTSFKGKRITSSQRTRILKIIKEKDKLKFILVGSKKIENEECDANELEFICIYFIQDLIDDSSKKLIHTLKNENITLCLTSEKVSDLNSIVSQEVGKIRSTSENTNTYCPEDIVASSTDVERLMKSDFFLLCGDCFEVSKLIHYFNSLNITTIFLSGRDSDSFPLSEASVGISYTSSSEIGKASSDVIIKSTDQLSDLLSSGKLYLINLKKVLKFIYSGTIPILIPVIMYTIFGFPPALSPMISLFMAYIVDFIPIIGFSYEEAEIDTIRNDSAFTREINTFNNESRCFRRFLNLFRNSLISFKEILIYGARMGLIIGVTCYFIFLSSLYKSGFKLGDLFNSSDKYFKSDSLNVLSREGNYINPTEQLLFLKRAQGTFFIGLSIFQFSNSFICRRDRSKIFNDFFNNKTFLITSFLALLSSLIVVYFDCISSFVDVGKPDTILLIFPIVNSIIAILIKKRYQ